MLEQHENKRMIKKIVYKFHFNMEKNFDFSVNNS